jgi:RNA polymerase-binding transcription factor DksA
VLTGSAPVGVRAKGAFWEYTGPPPEEAVMHPVVRRPTELLRAMLEEQLHTHTIWLTELTEHPDPPDADERDTEVHHALITAARQGVADATAALRRMSDGTYGVCTACGRNIPLGRLRRVPEARFCVPCDRNRP